jgi:minimal PKS chain-length factor (CLF/KS beta)
MSASVVVTGIGVVSPNGLGTDEYWSATCNGESGIAPVGRFDATGYPARLAGEVPGFVAKDHLPSRLLPQTDHMTRLALTAADWALADSGLERTELADFDMGVITASSAGGFEFGQRELQNLWSKGSTYVSAYQSFAWFYAVNTGQISIRHGMKGPSGVVVADGAGGLDAIAQARRQLRKGSKLIVSGGVDGSICPWGWVAQMAGDRLSTSDDPATAYLPFDDRAAGYVPGEGGAILILEDAESARVRGARQVYGEIAGYAATFDPPRAGAAADRADRAGAAADRTDRAGAAADRTDRAGAAADRTDRAGAAADRAEREPEREPTLRRAIELALRDAAAEPDDIDVVFADACAIPGLDLVEAEAITAVFGPHGVPVTVPKTMTGRLYAGAAAVDVAAALLAIRDQLIPPTVNVRPAQRYQLDLVTGHARPAPVRTALVIARGHAGFNSALVLRAVDPS